MTAWCECREPSQHRRLGQALQIDHGVIGMAPQPLAQSLEFAARARRPPRLAPATQRRSDHIGDTFNALDQRREGGLDDPLDLGRRMSSDDVLHRGHLGTNRPIEDSEIQMLKAESIAFASMCLRSHLRVGLTARSTAMTWPRYSRSALVWPSKRINSTPAVVFDGHEEKPRVLARGRLVITLGATV